MREWVSSGRRPVSTVTTSHTGAEPAGDVDEHDRTRPGSSRPGPPAGSARRPSPGSPRRSPPRAPGQRPSGRRPARLSFLRMPLPALSAQSGSGYAHHQAYGSYAFILSQKNRERASPAPRTRQPPASPRRPAAWDGATAARDHPGPAPHLPRGRGAAARERGRRRPGHLPGIGEHGGAPARETTRPAALPAGGQECPAHRRGEGAAPSRHPDLRRPRPGRRAAHQLPGRRAGGDLRRRRARGRAPIGSPAGWPPSSPPTHAWACASAWLGSGT